jgi:hypothetical protein
MERPCPLVGHEEMVQPGMQGALEDDAPRVRRWTASPGPWASQTRRSGCTDGIGTTDGWLLDLR